VPLFQFSEGCPAAFGPILFPPDLRYDGSSWFIPFTFNSAPEGENYLQMREKIGSVQFARSWGFIGRMGRSKASRIASLRVLPVELHFTHDNFARIAKTLRIAPAMSAGISKQILSYEDIASLSL